MRRLLILILAFCAGLTCSVLPRVADAFVVLMQALLVALGTVAVVALCAFAVVWLRRRGVLTYRTGESITTTADTPEKTEHAFNTPSIDDIISIQQWQIAYLQLSDLARHKRGRYTLRAVEPYIEHNSRRYWEWMREEMERIGFVVKDPKAGFVWRGSYRRFATELRMGIVTLAPHPELPAPRVLWIMRGPGTAGTDDADNTPSTVIVSPMGIVYRGT